MIFGTNLSTLNIGLMICGTARWQEAEATRKRFRYCTDPLGQEILYLRALQGHSGRNPIDPTLQDNVLIPNNFFEYIYHIGCAINLHSITNSGLIAGGQNSSKERQTVFFTAVNPMTKYTEIRTTLTWKHRVLHHTCRQHGRNIKTRCIGSTSDLLKRKDESSIRRDRTPSSFTIHSQPIVSRRLSRWKLEISYATKYMSHLGRLRRFP